MKNVSGSAGRPCSQHSGREPPALEHPGERAAAASA